MFDLEAIKDPTFLKKLKKKELEILADEIRSFLIENISKTGGHLASNLGIVELTIALHTVFDSPHDKIVFDVGHQVYTHKILTGRASKFETLRKIDGLSGFISREESEHDCFETGHSGESLSAISGFLRAKKDGVDIGECIAVIGDSSIASGMPFEALNYLGSLKEEHPIIVINDNKMGISKSVGALSSLLNRIRGMGFAIKMKKIFYRILPQCIINFFRRIIRGIKAFIQNDNIFEDLGFRYMGPVDGNDIHSVIKILTRAKKCRVPCVVHVITEKGKGYKKAEEDVYGDYHGVPPFDINTGLPLKPASENSHTWSKIISESVLKLEEEFNIDVIVPAMIGGSKLGKFKTMYPDKIIDVGIAEEHATTMASSLAMSGVNVFLPIYSTFAQRAYDQINNDICRHNAHVVIGIDRAGIVGEDGSTHQGIFDVAYLSHIPNIVISMPSTPDEAFALIKYGFVQKNPFVIRYPRGSMITDLSFSEAEEIEKPSWIKMTDGNKIIIISYGPNVKMIEELCIENKISATIVNARFIKPLDTKMLDELVDLRLPFLIYEEVVKEGSLASMILLYFAKKHYNCYVDVMDLPCNYIKHGEIKAIKERLEMDPLSIRKRIELIINENR